jgi:hypothetical protein
MFDLVCATDSPTPKRRSSRTMLQPLSEVTAIGAGGRMKSKIVVGGGWGGVAAASSSFPHLETNVKRTNLPHWNAQIGKSTAEQEEFKG